MNRDEELTLKLTAREVLIVRICLQIVGKHSSLHEIFEDEDAAWCHEHDQDPYECDNKPTDRLETKFAFYAYPNDDEHVIEAVRKANQ